jgi:hypothetical protein
LEGVIFVLAVLAIVLGIVTLVGHGLWLLLAALFRDTTNQPPTLADFYGKWTCDRCLSPLGKDANCPICNWPGELPLGQRREQVLQAFGRQLSLYSQLGVLDEASHKELLTAFTALAEPIVAEANESIADDAFAEPAFVEIPSTVANEVSNESDLFTLASDGESGNSSEETIMAVGAMTPEERVRNYVASRQAAGIEPDQSPTLETAPRRPAFSKLFAAFLEEKNVRWGELVGGLLIVCCSIALVISFWSEIAARPLLKFCIFNGVSAALFGAGFYTDRHWKIHTTSRGLLIIAVMLVPLNFLAIAAFTDKSPPTDLLALGGEAISLALFTALVYAAGRIVTPEAAPLLAVGVMAPSLMQLLIRRFADPLSSTSLLYSLAGVPAATYLATCSLDVRRLARRSDLSEQAANRLFVVLGVLTYSMLLPWALLLHKTSAFQPTLERLAPLIALCGVPSLATGLLFWRRRDAGNQASMQTAGIGVGVLGASVMLGALGLAWPTPPAVLPTALVNAAVFTFVACWFAIPQAHLAAGICALMAWVVGFHVAWGNLTWTLNDHEPLVRTLLSASSGNALTPLVVLLLAGAYAWKRAGRSPDALWWVASAALAAAVSLALAFVFGFARPGDPFGVTWTYLLYALGASGAAIRLNRPAAAWAASALLLAALIQSVVFRFAGAMPPAQAWIAALLLHASIATACAAAVARFRREDQHNLQQPLLQAGLITTVIAASLLVVGSAELSWNILAAALIWLAVVWLTLSSVSPWQQLFTAFQIAMIAALFCVVTAQLESRSWYAAATRPWIDPWFLQTQGVAFALFCLAWKGTTLGAIRLFAGSGQDETSPSWRRGLHALEDTATLPVIRFLEAAIVLLALALAIYAAAPGIAQELAPLDRPGLATRVVPPASDFEVPGAPHLHAAGRGAWILLAAVGVMLVADLRGRPAAASALGLLAAAASACLVAAAWWEAEVSVASALRWLLAAVFATGSGLLWMRRRLVWNLRAGRFWQQAGDALWLQSTATNGYRALNALVVAPYLAMMAHVGLAAIEKAGGLAVPTSLLAAAAVVFVVSSLAALSLRRVAYGGWVDFEPASAPSKSYAPALLLVLGSAPLLVTVAFAAAAALKEHPLAGPEPGAWFRQIGWSASYGIPLAVIVLTLLGAAIRERSSQYAFAAGLLLNFVTTLVYLLETAKAGRGLDGVTWVELAQVNCIVAAVVTLGWLAAVRWHQRSASPRVPQSLGDNATDLPPLLSTQAAITTALCSLAIAPALVGLFIQPAVWNWVATAGGPLGWIAVVLTGAAILFTARESVGDSTVHRRGWHLATAAGMLALAAARADSGNLLGYHALLVGSAATAWMMSLVRLQRSNGYTGMRGDPAAVRWSTWLGAAAVLIALRSPPLGSVAWWTIGGLLATALLAGWLSWITSRRSFLWVAGPLLNLAASVWWIEYGSRMGRASGDELAALLLINVLAAAVACIVSVVLEHKKFLPAIADAPRRRGIGFHLVASWACTGLLLLLALVGLASDAFGSPLTSSGWLRSSALAMTVLAAIACLWDPAVRFAVVRLYCVGLVGVAMFLDALDVSGHLFGWILTLLLSAYALLTSYLWSQRHKLRALTAHWGVPRSAALTETLPYHGQGWFVTANSILAAAVTVLVFWIELSYPAYAERMVAAYAVLAVALALAFLAKGAMRSRLQYAALTLGVLFAIAFGWSWLPVPIEAALLHRTAVAAVALTVMIPLYGFGVIKLWRSRNEWTQAAERLVPLLTALSAVFFLAVLGIEVTYFLDQGAVPIRTPALIAVAAGLVALAVAALAAALLPGHDPLGLSERGRTVYVYAAEALLGLLFLHIRITMPWLFRGWFLQFWPLVVMGIAFLGIGIAEWCRRRRQHVLSEPLENTGALLPMLPALGYWILPSHINYSLVLLSVGTLYSILSVMRRSFLFGMLATLAANGSLWYLLHSADGLGLLQHPQLWLIPPAVCMLVAAYLNRSRLTPEQMTATRYSAAIVIYASSTADIFVNGVGEAPWLPLVLAGLSLLGIFVGIWARVQAFLYLGLSFLLIALFTVIWYAAVELDRTWIWWVSGIVTGVLIMILFGLFEKKRDEILRLAEQIRQWDA